MSTFLLELRCEEIPARMQKGARADLEKLFRAEMVAAGIQVGDVTVWSTPRRLALIARDLPMQTEAVSEEAKGPPEGAPDQAIDGFCRKNGVTRESLELRDVKGRMTYFAVIEQPGRAVVDVLAQAIPAIIRAFPWPKSMRWGAASISTESLRWVRPLSGIVAIFGEQLVTCEVDGVTSGCATLGHRFHHPGPITIGGAHDYAEKLRACHVIVDHAERETMIRSGAAKAAADAGLDLVEDEGLVVENAGLTEWPVPLVGRFEEDYLQVPPEVIQLTARVNQKYFVCTRSPAKAGASTSPNEVPAFAGTQALANAFICTANIEAADGGEAIVDGNRKVLAARLSDARFFWDVDRKKTLEEHAKGLERITFHEKLGTVADKVERVAKLARWLVEEGIVGASVATPRAPAKAGASIGEVPGGERSQPSLGLTKEELADQAELAARLCKADLVTEMVGEFPELQGLMGGYYARAEGLPDAVADAIRDHYKPVGQGDDVPTAPVTVAVSLADKLDTLSSFFANDDKPTGSKDPYALRRAAIGVVALLEQNKIRLSLCEPYRASFLPARMNLRLDNSEVPNARKAIEQNYFEAPLLFANFQGDNLKETFEFLEDRSRGKMTPAEIESFGLARSEEYKEEYFSAERAFLDFFADRLKVQQRGAGIRHDLIDAVFALGGEDDLVRLLARVHALQSFMATEDGTNLLAGYKRAANILKKEGVVPAKAGTVIGQGAPSTAIPASAGMTDDSDIVQTGDEDPMENVDDPDMKAVYAAAKQLSYTPEPAEKALSDALGAAQPKATAAIEAEDFSAAMAALASLRAPIDAFFEEVTVNDPQENKRTARLDLLARFRAAVHNVADFSKIEG